MVSGASGCAAEPAVTAIAATGIAVAPALGGMESPESVNCWKPWSAPYVLITVHTPSAPLRSTAFAVWVGSSIVQPSEIENDMRPVITGDPGGIGGCGGTYGGL